MSTEVAYAKAEFVAMLRHNREYVAACCNAIESAAAKLDMDPATVAELCATGDAETLAQMFARLLTNEERVTLFSGFGEFCSRCGRFDKDRRPRGCQCWNDE